MTDAVLDEIARRYRVVAADRAVDGERAVVGDGGPGLVHALAADIYARVHARSVPAVVGTADAAHTPESAAAFLGTAQHDRTFADPEWVLRSPADRLVMKEGLVLRLPVPGDDSPDPLAGVGRGETCTIDLPCERLRALVGCYLRIGTSGPWRPGERTARVYLHPAAELAGPVFAELCAGLDAAGLRYRAKVFNSVDRCRRADAIVVEFSRADRAAVVRTAAAARPREATVPGFSARVVDGLGYATQAVGAAGTSLGQHRSRLAAEGLVRAFRDGASGASARRRSLATVFSGSGLDDRRPWRSPRPADVAAGAGAAS